MRLTKRLYNSKLFIILNELKSNQIMVFGERVNRSTHLSEQSREPTNLRPVICCGVNVH